MVDEDCTGEMETLVPELGVRHRSTGHVFSSRLAQRVSRCSVRAWREPGGVRCSASVGALPFSEGKGVLGPERVQQPSSISYVVQ